mmetsp:Transcript_11864/g.22529  ORF Transcript_11864/g.22529 Transcript_11864/m.22529 type:complete len:87 (+) Transcript_11864:205-465(+)
MRSSWYEGSMQEIVKRIFTRVYDCYDCANCECIYEYILPTVPPFVTAPGESSSEGRPLLDYDILDKRNFIALLDHHLLSSLVSRYE